MKEKTKLKKKQQQHYLVKQKQSFMVLEDHKSHM